MNPMTPPTAVAVDRPGPARIQKMNPAVIVGVRVARTYLQVFVALMGAALAAPAVLPPEMRGWVLLPIASQAAVAAQLALLPAILCLIQNVLELLAKLDATAPEMRA